MTFYQKMKNWLFWLSLHVTHKSEIITKQQVRENERLPWIIVYDTLLPNRLGRKLGCKTWQRVFQGWENEWFEKGCPVTEPTILKRLHDIWEHGRGHPVSGFTRIEHRYATEGGT